MAVMRCLGASPTPGEVQRHLHLHKIGESRAAEGTEMGYGQKKKKDEHIEVQLSGPGRGFLLVGCFFFGRRTEQGARAGWGLQH